MSGEEQERFEDYLELEHYIEELQAGRVAHPPVELTPSQAHIYRMAALFRSAAPEAGEPRPEFAAELQARLEQELHEQPKKKPFPFLRKRQHSGDSGKTKRLGNVSRRALLTGGAAVAASLVAGAAIEHVVEQAQTTPVRGGQTKYTTPLVGEGVPTTRLFVTTLAQLGDEAMRFTSDAVIGYLIRNDGDDPEEVDAGPVIAVSASCTHMGCIVQWQNADRKFHCPCHGGRFTEYGKPDTGVAPVLYLRALPRLKATVDKNGDIYVEVPASRS